MKKQSLFLERSGFIIFTFAIILGVCLMVVSAWPDLEALVYGFRRFTEDPLKSLSCPMLLTRQDRAQITVKLNNPNDKVINRKVEAQFSTPMTLYSVEEWVELQPGETKIIAWEVGAENIDLKRFIFASVRAYPAKSLPLVESTCGILVLNLPFKGGMVLFYVTLALAAVGLIFGLWLWTRNTDLSRTEMITQSRFMRFLTGVIIVGVAGSMLGWWLLGLLSLITMLLTWSVFLYPRKTTI